MIIIGNEHPGIRSISWNDVYGPAISEISDYQILLIDLNSYFRISEPEAFRNVIINLLKTGNKVVYILPREEFSNPSNRILPLGFATVKKLGKTIHFHDADPLISKYREYIDRHEIILIQTGPLTLDWVKGLKAVNLMRNNLNELCSIRFGNLYLLHPPDKSLEKQAIKGLVEHFSPDFEEEEEDKPEWVSSYELTDLGLQIFEDEIQRIDKEIEKFDEEKNQKITQKEEIAKWSDLITRKTTTLEIRLKEAFELLGAEKVEHEPKGSHGPDLVITHNNMGFTIEIEGTKGPIRIDKARELLHWIANAPIGHKGILIGNPFCEISPIDRPPQNTKLFVKEAIELAEFQNLSLVNSYDVFKIVCKKLRGEKINIDDILDKIFQGKGEISI